jgi:cholesterol oxidase
VFIDAWKGGQRSAVDFDAIVIGSGFGGAITACRLAEKGQKVLILERGREWDKASYPRAIEDDWIWSHSHPEKYHGWLDLRVFKGMSVALGAGVGGGSLIYANISRVPPPTIFANGWPAEIKFSELAPYYATVGKMLNVQKVPANQWNPRMKLMQEAATKLNDLNRFETLDLAVTFDKDLQYDFDQEPDISKSTMVPNEFGVLQGKCVHLGECDIGCRVYAKNTLDKNYIPVAVKKGAKVWPLHFVVNIEQIDGGYCVYFDQLADGDRIPGKATATRVIVAAGSLGSTELLLRCRDVTHSLPRLSSQLGKRWSSNGDFLTPALHVLRSLWSDRGPTIASAINYLDGSQNGQIFWVQDGGIPNVLNKYFEAVSDRLQKAPNEPSWLETLAPHEILQHLALFSESHDLFRHIMPWFAQGVDTGDGELMLTDGSLDLKWDLSASLGLFNEIAAKHKQLAESTGGIPIPLPGWALDKELITPHPLGGCNMGATSADGVVDHKGEVFDYPNLFVADGAIIPRPLGVNPSRTIGALAERIAALIAV